MSKMELCNSRQSVCAVCGLKSQFQARGSVPFLEQITILSNDFCFSEEPAESNLLANRSTVWVPRKGFRAVRNEETRFWFPFSFPGGWNPVKRYPNGTVTGTCPVVRGPDDEPEIGSQGSECRATGHRCESGSETTQFSSTFDLCSQDIKDRFFATNGKEMLPPPVSTWWIPVFPFDGSCNEIYSVEYSIRPNRFTIAKNIGPDRRILLFKSTNRGRLSKVFLFRRHFRVCRFFFCFSALTKSVSSFFRSRKILRNLLWKEDPAC